MWSKIPNQFEASALSAASHNLVLRRIAMKNSCRALAIALLSLLATSPANIGAAQPLGSKCHTPYFVCVLSGQHPVGSACYCAGPQGPVPGTVGQ
jgi:hypothetical protein